MEWFTSVSNVCVLNIYHFVMTLDTFNLNPIMKSIMKLLRLLSLICLKPHSHCAGVATVHPNAGQPVYRDAPGHIS